MKLVVLEGNLSLGIVAATFLVAKSGDAASRPRFSGAFLLPRLKSMDGEIKSNTLHSTIWRLRRAGNAFLGQLLGH